MYLKIIIKVTAIIVFLFINPLFAEDVLGLPVIEGSHSVGNDQNVLGINAYKKKNLIKL